MAVHEFKVFPVGARNFREAIHIGAEIYHNLRNVIKTKYVKDAANLGDEAGLNVPGE